MTIEEVLDLDVLTFNAYVASVHRITTADRIAEAYLVHVATQGQTKDLKKFVKRLAKDVGLSGQKKEESQMGDLKHLVGVLMKGKGL